MKLSNELVVRPARTRAPKPPPTFRQIKIYHPDYDDEIVPLISFSGYDSEEGHIWYDVAHTACAIISNNRWDGYLSESRDFEMPHVDCELLAPGDYWWHLPGESSQPYAIVSDFRIWQMPPFLPAGWTSGILKREQPENSCQLSQEYHALNQAHIVPISETEWFNKNGLGFSHGANPSNVNTTALTIGIDNDNNLLALRSDLHHAWDQRNFTFLPKGDEPSQIVMHCWTEEMVTEYHNLPLQGFVRRELLLARFAWTLLPRALIPFLTATKESRMIWTRNDDGKLVPQRTAADLCSEIANASVPRSTSPKKRKQNDAQQQINTSRRNETKRSYLRFDSGLGLREEDEEQSQDEEEDADDGLMSTNPEELTRGRKRLRTGEAWSSYPEPILCSSSIIHIPRTE